MDSRTKIDTGRTQQKQRTRNAVLNAARRVLERGDKPRLADVAEEAGVSRATIYRYFPSEEILLIEVTLDGLVPEFGELIEGYGDDPVERTTRITRAYYDHTARNEAAFRMFLRAVLEAVTAEEREGKAARGGRRPEAFAAALEPCRSSLDKRTYDNLRYALSALTGIEALIAMKDVCGLSDRRGREALVWAAKTLVEAATENH